MRVQVAIPEAHVDAPVLDAALESVTRLNESMIKTGRVPTFDQGLVTRNIKWKPEPPGDEHFDHAAEVMRRGHGDCDDLAPWHAASLRATGEDPGATAIVRRSGPRRWHAIVKRSDGTVDDPSKAAGMGRSSVVGDLLYEGIHGAAVPLMYEPPSQAVGGAYIVKPAIALRPFAGNWQARADLPWNWRAHMERDKATPTDYAMVSLHQDPVAQTALVGAIDGAVQLGHHAGFAHKEHIDRLCALSDAIEGMPYEDLAKVYGPELADHVTQLSGSFLSKALKVAKKGLNVVRKVSPLALTAKAVSKIPGAGKILAAPLRMAEKQIFEHPEGLVQFIPGVGPVAKQLMDQATQAASMMNMHPNEMAQLLSKAEVWPSIAAGDELSGHYPFCHRSHGDELIVGGDGEIILGAEVCAWLDA